MKTQILNLDAMSQNELHALVFRRDVPEIYKTYAQRKIDAMNLRFAEKFETAAYVERVCQRIYSIMPVHLQW